MILFQYIFVPLVALFLIRSILKLARGGQPRGIALLGVVIWLSAGFAILWPDLTIRIARVMGIGRGADLVLYLLAISFFLSVFYFYNKILKLQSDISEIVRRIALSDAVELRPQSGPPLGQEEKNTGEVPVDRSAEHTR